MRIFEAKSYKEYIVSELKSDRFPTGVKSKLAKFMGVQPSFISLVLSGPQSFSPEHGLKIAEFLGLDRNETQILLLLIQKERAGTHALKEFLEDELRALRAQNNQIKSRVKSNVKELSPEDLAEYYSSWHNTAVHMGVRISEYSDPTKLAHALKIDLRKVKKSLAFLERVGFVQNDKGKWVVTDQRFHFAEKTPMLRSHHTNWRTAAVKSLDDGSDEDMHYSAVMSIDEKCFEEIKKLILDSIEKMDPIIKDAKDKKICALTFDLFKLTD